MCLLRWHGARMGSCSFKDQRLHSQLWGTGCEQRWELYPVESEKKERGSQEKKKKKTTRRNRQKDKPQETLNHRKETGGCWRGRARRWGDGHEEGHRMEWALGVIHETHQSLTSTSETSNNTLYVNWIWKNKEINLYIFINLKVFILTRCNFD